MKVYTAPAGIACGDCGYAIRFERDTDWNSGYATGECSHRHCANFERPFRFLLASVEVEFIDGTAPTTRAGGSEC
ncbi:hypothetical protein [Caballeronia sp. ATUFL_M1_KS5A]|uniref:hypothetical protein n=1 Tax=Caballeronia sp. ATUFL_M1_KS5A TaxID=2921778 RepID=UPI0020292843|nr:hypothetical protein [Caballeronia sp. ATUFL_M1_KS5A]